MAEFSTAKGTVDFFGTDALLHEYIQESLQKTFRLFGFEPLHTPALETLEVLGFKGGGEINAETFKVEERGDRGIGLRFDQTVPMARFVASNPQVPFPFKRYVIGPVFRDGPTQVEQGRFRQFTQADVDIIGVQDMSAEAELLSLADYAFKDLGMGEVVFKVNNRHLLNGIFEQAKVPDLLLNGALVALDKYDKIGIGGVTSELTKLNHLGITLDNSSIDSVISMISLEGSNMEKLGVLSSKINNSAGKKGISEISDVIKFAEASGLSYVSFEPTVARGLAYYTGTVMEVYSREGHLPSAILAGGRFDDMIGEYAGKGETIPAVGFSFGVERVAKQLRGVRDFDVKSTTDIYIVPVKPEFKSEAFSLGQKLRGQGINTSISLSDRSVGRELGYADKKGFKFVALIGDKEISGGFVTLKNMESGNQVPVLYDSIRYHTAAVPKGI